MKRPGYGSYTRKGSLGDKLTKLNYKTLTQKEKDIIKREISNEIMNTVEPLQTNIKKELVLKYLNNK